MISYIVLWNFLAHKVHAIYHDKWQGYMLQSYSCKFLNIAGITYHMTCYIAHPCSWYSDRSEVHNTLLSHTLPLQCITIFKPIPPPRPQRIPYGVLLWRYPIKRCNDYFKDKVKSQVWKLTLRWSDDTHLPCQRYMLNRVFRLNTYGNIPHPAFIRLSG